MEHKKSTYIFSYFFILLIGIIPLVFSQNLADPTLLSRQIYLAGVWLILGLAIIFNKEKKPVNFPKAFIWLNLLWLAVTLNGISYALNQPEAWYTMSKVSLIVAGLWIGYYALQSGSIQWQSISWGISLASGISLFLLVKEIIELRAEGTALWEQKNLYALQTAFGHKNLYASFQMLCLPFIFHLYLQAQKWSKAWLFINLLLAILSIGLIQTKSVILGILIALFIGISSAILYKRKQAQQKVWIPLIIYILGIAALAIFIQQHPTKFTLLLNNDTIKERMLLWSNTWQMIKEHFILGVGPGNWQIYFPKYGLGNFMETNYLVSDGYTTFQRPHNDFLWILSETGIVGFLAYTSLLLYYLYKGIKRIKENTNKQENIALMGFVLVAVAYCFVAAVDFPLERNEHQFIWALLCCVLIGSDHNPQNTINGKHWLKAAFILLLFSFVFGLARYKQEKYAKKIIEAHRTSQWNLILKTSKQIQPKLLSIDNFSIPIKWYEGLAHYSLQNPAMAKTCFLQAYEINPYQVHVLNNVASTYEQEGEHEKALQFYDKLLSISPTQPDAILNKSAVLFNMKNTEAAMACLYQFKFDAKNEQFLIYLNAIGSAYLNSRAVQAPTKEAINAAYIQKFFRYNQENNIKFDQLIIPPYE